MHEALIQNWIRMIPWGDFWEPVTIRQKWIKWTVILLLLSLAISIFVFQLDDIQAHEYACEHPIIVEAERQLVYTHDIYHDIYLSYTYDGIQYDDVYYSTSKNPGIRWDGVTTLTVAVDPNAPGMPVRNMFHEGPAIFAVVLWSLGLSMLIYGIAIEFSGFREWRVRQANRPGFLSRPYGKPIKYVVNPDYLKDYTFIFIPITFTSTIILMLTFPYTFS